jgi:enoyl-CoA hydratase/carnithine racemase
MSERTIRTRRDGQVLLVELHRPDRLNAFDWEMREELARLWRATASDRTLRAVVITGAGKGFCAGADVGDLAGARRPFGDGVDDELSFLPGPQLEIPVVVAVNGVCAGGGLHFVADGDIVIASEAAMFTDPHVSVGQVSAIEPVSLALRVPVPRLLRLALLGRGERLTAADALAAGLVSEVMPADRLAPRAAELASLIAASSPAAIAATRRVLRSLERRLLHDAMAEGWAEVQAHWAHPDATEGPRSFGERRQPVWLDGAVSPSPGPSSGGG